MNTDISIAPTPKWMLWLGRILSCLVVALLLFSGVMKFNMTPTQLAEFHDKLGWETSILVTLAIVEITSTVLYLIPQTAVLGAILLTGYLGGATATHARVNDMNFVMPVIVGVFVWLGLFLRDARVRALLPWRGV